MISFADRIAALEAEGYANAPAMAKLAHDVVLKTMEKCGFARNITVKGGVVMSSITGDIRRATMDMDVDFVRYGLSDENIETLIDRLNCLDGIRIVRNGDITDLRHQNYRGKRVYLDIVDQSGVVISTKLDVGVHVYRQMPQRRRRFSIAIDDGIATLPANTKEQIFAEKLKSLLRLGARSNRLKDVFDLYYLKDRVDIDILRRFVTLLIFTDDNMREHDFRAVSDRVRWVFRSSVFMRRLSQDKANWLKEPVPNDVSGILEFLERCS